MPVKAHLKKQAKPLKVHGGKHYLKNHIRKLAHNHKIRVFGCVGGWSEGWEWGEEGVGEIINDVDGWLINFYQVLAHPKMHLELIRRLRTVPFSEKQWIQSTAWIKASCPDSSNAVDAACHYFWSMRLSMGGRCDSFAPPSTCRLRNGMVEQASAYYGAVEGLPQASARLRAVMIYCMQCWELVRKFDKKGVWIYLDPPYFPDTRVSKKVYRHEMTADQHHLLLAALGQLKHAKFLLSGYDCPAYRMAKQKYGWDSITVGRPNAASTKKSKDIKKETFWANYSLAGRL